MVRRLPPLVAAGIAVGLSLVVAALWWRRPHAPIAESALDATTGVRISRHDAFGIPSKPVAVREPSRVRAIVEALGVDGLPVAACPPDYASAEVGLLLSGRDVYARRNVYVWNLSRDGTNVIVSSSAGCRGGAPADAKRLRELVLGDERDASSSSGPPER